MAAPSMASVSQERRDLDPAMFRMHGSVAGLLGAAVLAIWFFVLDLWRGTPLATPTFLAQALLSGGAAGETAQSVIPSLGQTFVFTVVHGIVFVTIGVTVAEFPRVFDLVHSRAFAIVLLFGALCLAFLVFGAMFAALGPDRIAIRDAFIGNFLAAFAMAGYLAGTLGASKCA
ncbi:MAG: hypothetical protein FJ148_03420 [Deltaproteobacteria bacterium]|nr:hypothetical protein [Deltaproteobacteria bacterium]